MANEIDKAKLVNDVAIMTVLHWLVERSSTLAKGRDDMLSLLRHQLSATQHLVEDLNDAIPTKADNDQ
jgi:hypothetical protein